MNSLKEDKDEVTADLHRWVSRKRREAGIGPNEKSTWFAYLECPDDPNGGESHWSHMGRSPGDVLADASSQAVIAGAVSRGTGRWLMDNRAGESEDGVYSLYLIVRPVLDPEAP